MTALVQVPDVNLVAVLAGQQQLRVYTVFYHVWRPPFGGDEGVVPQVPPEVIGQLLWATILFPRALQLKCVRIHQENATRGVSGRRSECAPVNAVWSTMKCVGRSVTGFLCELLGLDHLRNLRLPGIRFRIQDVNPG